jgi:hypothetical protein
MIPSSDELEKLVHDLQARVKHLEERLEGSSRPAGVGNGVRMVLMGPPGAGMHLSFFLCLSQMILLWVSFTH